MSILTLDRGLCERVSSSYGMSAEEYVANSRYIATGRKHNVIMTASTEDTMTFQVTKAR